MTSQAKRLRKLLKVHGITDYHRPVPRVRTERTKAGEWGRARATCRLLNDDQVAALKASDPYIEIQNVPCGRYPFSVIYT